MKISYRFGTRETGIIAVSPEELGTMVAATGEADIIKFIQTMPGISAGAEGSSAYYARGGNLGSNLLTLDGVPIYGSSHLLGFSSVFPQDIIETSSFQIGGFTSEEGNLTASHVKLISKDNSFKDTTLKVSASNFMLGGNISVPIVPDKLSLVGSIRLSPIWPEYAIIKPFLRAEADSISRFRAIVYDIFGKLTYKVDNGDRMSLSIFHSLDTYSYRFGQNSNDRMSWNNLIVNFKYDMRRGKWDLDNGFSFNRYSSGQGLSKVMGGYDNNLAISTTIDEIMLQSTAVKKLGAYGSLQGGFKSRTAFFNPGSSSRFSGNGLLVSRESPWSGKWSTNIINTLHAQLEKKKEGKYDFRAAGRLNLYCSNSTSAGTWVTRFNPEASLLARINFAKWLGIEATADYVVQYFHTLEGVPLGWSLDMTVPTDDIILPEKATQYYSGIFSEIGNHRISIGAYDKKMNNLVYYGDATKLFSSALAGWRDNIETGRGTSRGIEALYEKNGEVLTYRFAYTWSKTDRTFPKLNGGAAFPAKFDRRHIFNANVTCLLVRSARHDIGLSALYTYQSGNWETVAAGYYTGETIHGEETDLNYYTTLNNYEMPAYTRLDIGCFIRLRGDRYDRNINVGIYNVLNKHNPFMITYNPDAHVWKQISLLPIMPSIKYEILF